MRCVRLLMFIAMAAVLVGPARGLAAGTPIGVVETLHEALLAVMRDAAELSVEDRYARLAPTLSEAYDFETMARLAVGSAWTEASRQQRTALAEAFSRFSIATYAKRFSGYSGERFETIGEKGGPRTTILVETRLIRPADPPVPLTYVLAEAGKRLPHHRRHPGGRHQRACRPPVGVLAGPAPGRRRRPRQAPQRQGRRDDPRGRELNGKDREPTKKRTARNAS